MRKLLILAVAFFALLPLQAQVSVEFPNLEVGAGLDTKFNKVVMTTSDLLSFYNVVTVHLGQGSSEHLYDGLAIGCGTSTKKLASKHITYLWGDKDLRVKYSYIGQPYTRADDTKTLLPHHAFSISLIF